MLSLQSIKTVIKSIHRDTLAELKKLDKLSFSISDIDDNIFQNQSLDSLDLIHFATLINNFFNIHKTGREDLLLRKRSLEYWAELCKESLESNGGLITFQTSGTIGKPKDITHSLSELYREAFELKKILEPFDNIISLVPGHHIYGFLFGVLLPEVSSKEVKYVNYMTLSNLKENSLIISVPSQWDIWKENLKANTIILKGVSSAGKLNADTFDELINYNIEMYEFYGSTETLGIGYRKNPKDDFELFSYYEINENKIFDKDFNKEIELMDFYEVTSERTIKVLGRKDGAIKIHGHKIYLDDIRESIQKNDLILDCAVKIYKTEIGEKIKCFIVPKSFDKKILEEIKNFINSLNFPVAISNIKFGNFIPRNEMGKITDWEI